MTEKVEKKKKETEETLPSPNGEGIQKSRDEVGPSPEQLMSMEEAGKQFFQKMAKQPGKLEGMMKKLQDIDIDDVLEKITSPHGSVSDDPIIRVIQEDIVLLGEALQEIDTRVVKQRKAIEYLIADMEEMKEVIKSLPSTIR